jgi:hypothetical protein
LPLTVKLAVAPSFFAGAGSGIDVRDGGVSGAPNEIDRVVAGLDSAASSG